MSGRQVTYHRLREERVYTDAQVQWDISVDNRLMS